MNGCILYLLSGCNIYYSSSDIYFITSERSEIKWNMVHIISWHFISPRCQYLSAHTAIDSRGTIRKGTWWGFGGVFCYLFVIVAEAQRGSELLLGVTLHHYLAITHQATYSVSLICSTSGVNSCYLLTPDRQSLLLVSTNTRKLEQFLLDRVIWFCRHTCHDVIDSLQDWKVADQ